MKKEDFVKLGISEENAKKLEAAWTDELKGYIPKARFDEVNGEKKRLEAAVAERDEQLEALKNSTGNVEAMKKEIAELQASNTEKDKAHAVEIKQMKLDAAVESALVGAKAKNTVAVKALLKDLDKAQFGEDGKVIGLSDQIAALQKSDAYLFEAKEPAKIIKGAKPGEAGNEPADKPVDISKMTYSETLAYLEANPDAKIE